MRKLARAIVRFILSEAWLAPIFVIYNRVFEVHIRAAWGKACLTQVKNASKTSRINGRVCILSPDGLTIGSDVRIGRGCHFHCAGGVLIGDNTQISRNVIIYSSNHNYNGAAVPYDDSEVLQPVIIGRHVWIGMNACILPGVTIGDGAIIGLGAVISRNVDAGSIVVGACQRIVGSRDLQRFAELDVNNHWFGKSWPNS